MPTNIQYNTPMPIYSREAAEEQYKQQIGDGPLHAVGLNDRHFDPKKSETLKAIKAYEDSDLGASKFAQFGGTQIKSPAESHWAYTASKKPERARSVTPSKTFTSPNQPYYTPNYSTLQHVRKNTESHRRDVANRKFGYEFGGADYVDRSQLKFDEHLAQIDLSGGQKRESADAAAAAARMLPGYQMGAVDYRKGAVRASSEYRGHGPEPRKLHSRFEDAALRRDQMNIELAPNVDNVSADILIGDTISNQHIQSDQRPDHSFGTPFAPLSGQRTRRAHSELRSMERSPQPPVTFSLSAKKTPANWNQLHSTTSVAVHQTGIGAQLAHDPDANPAANAAAAATAGGQRIMQNAAAANAHADAFGAFHSPTQQQQQAADQYRQQSSRSQSAAPMDRYQWMSERDRKEVTIETLLNDRALAAPKAAVIPEWHTRSLEKTTRWKNGLDPRLSRSKTHEYEPTWSRIVNDRRNVWEEKAKNLDEFVRRTPASKIPSEQPPYWYNKANHLHGLWQNEADRQRQDSERDNYGSHVEEQQQHTQFVEYAGHAKRAGDTHVKQQQIERDDRHAAAGDTGGFISQTQYSTYNDHQLTTDSHRVAVDHPAATDQLQHPSLHLNSTPSTVHNYGSREFAQKQQLHNYSRESLMEEDTSKLAPYGNERRSYRLSTHHESSQPLASSTTVITKLGDDFNRRTEMAETLPYGTIANAHANTEGNYMDSTGQPVIYKRELISSLNPNSESTLLKEEESRVTETPLEPGVISRHVTTKYYKKKTVTDTTVNNIVS